MIAIFSCYQLVKTLICIAPKIASKKIVIIVQTFVELTNCMAGEMRQTHLSAPGAQLLCLKHRLRAAWIRLGSASYTSYAIATLAIV